MSNEQSYFDANRALWNAKTPVHAQSKFYDVEGFKAGKTSLNPAELEVLGDLKGKSVLHLQCHFGMDTMSLARMGAKATGLDLSDAAIEKARELNAELGLDARFVRSNVYDAAAALGGEQYDLVFTSYGTVVWLPDLERWAEVIDNHLKPGGRFVFAEFHPVWDVFDWDTFDISYGYFRTDTPYEEMSEGTYTDRDADIRQKEYFWIHPISDIMGSLMARGLVIRDFQEYPYSYYNCFPNMEEIAPGKWANPNIGDKLPMMFRLVVEKPV